jgi:hypothetical protein
LDILAATNFREKSLTKMTRQFGHVEKMIGPNYKNAKITHKGVEGKYAGFFKNIFITQEFILTLHTYVPWQGCQIVYFQTENINLGKFQWSSNGRFYGPTYVCMYIHSFTDR